MVKLRKLEPSDLPFLYQWENDASAWPDSSIHNPLSRQDLRDYIASTTGDIYADRQLRLIIECNGAAVGCIDLFDLDIRNRKAAVGMYVAPDSRGKGIGLQAVQLLEEYASAQLNLRMIYAVIATSNEPCSHLYQKAGFTPSSPLPAWTLEADARVWTKLFQ